MKLISEKMEVKKVLSLLAHFSLCLKAVFIKNAQAAFPMSRDDLCERPS